MKFTRPLENTGGFPVAAAALLYDVFLTGAQVGTDIAATQVSGDVYSVPIDLYLSDTPGDYTMAIRAKTATGGPGAAVEFVATVVDTEAFPPNPVTNPVAE